MLDQVDRRLDDLPKIVRGDLGRHTDRDAIGSVDQKIGDPGRKHRRLLAGLVVVGNEANRLLLDVSEHLGGDPGQTGLGITVGGRGVAIDAPPVALSIDERVAHREVLGHAHHRIVDGRITVRMVGAEHVSDDVGRLLIGLAGNQPLLVHRVEDASVDRFETVAHVGKGSSNDHRHSVVEITPPHLVFDIDW